MALFPTCLNSRRRFRANPTRLWFGRTCAASGNSASLRIPGKRAQFFRMTPDISDNAMALLRSSAVAVRISPAQNLRLEFVDSIENRHPPFLDRLNAQPEIRA